ncbi:MAG: zinc-binding dehydrogenase [Anaerolineae bacterium]
MRAVAVPEPGRLELVEVPEPRPGPYEALTEILTCSICSGTDSHILNGTFRHRDYPGILGHESVGRVIECGPKVRYLHPGDLVLRPCAVRPGDPPLGGYHSLFGGFAEYGIVADAQAIIEDTPRNQQPPLPYFAAAQQVLPPDFDPDLAGAFITYKETFSFLQQLGVQPGKSLLILGSGTVGMNLALAGKFLGAYPVIVTARRQEVLMRALDVGADIGIDVSRHDMNLAVQFITDERGADFIVEAVGSWQVLQDGMRALASGGQIGIYGIAPESTATIDWSGMPSDWSLRFIHPREEWVHNQVLEQMDMGWLDLRQFISHTLTMDEIHQGFELVRSRQATKVVIRIRE